MHAQRLNVAARGTHDRLHTARRGRGGERHINNKRMEVGLLHNRSMPKQVLVPVLGYSDVAEAIARLCDTFGFVERWRVGNHRAQLAVGDGAAIAIIQGKPSAGPTADHVMVRVEDVDGHCRSARACGAEVTSEPTTMPYGERQYSVRDFSGRLWVFTESVADLAPEDWGGTSSNANRE
jgi:uncharacterized glyoxalase superfamily protein PhnB